MDKKVAARLGRQFTKEIDWSEYPARWQDMIGQEQAKRMLRVAARSARMRKKAMGHVLIAGPTGLGKTALAGLVAREMRTNCRVVSGNIDMLRARMLFADMEDCDVLLVDEAQEMKDPAWMLHYLQDKCLVGPRGPEPQPEVTIVAATTHAGKIPAPIVGRFLWVPPIVEYSDDDAAKIAQGRSRLLFGTELPPLGKADARLLATAAGNNPRAINRMVTTLRDATITGELDRKKSSRYDIPGLLAWMGVTPDGLDHVAQSYLTTMANEFGGTAGARAMVDQMQQPGGLDETERVLINRGLLTKTRSGRVLTREGIVRARELMVA